MHKLQNCSFKKILHPKNLLSQLLFYNHEVTFCFEQVFQIGMYKLFKTIKSLIEIFEINISNDDCKMGD